MKTYHIAAFFLLLAIYVFLHATSEYESNQKREELRVTMPLAEIYILARISDNISSKRYYHDKHEMTPCSKHEDVLLSRKPKSEGCYYGVWINPLDEPLPAKPMRFFAIFPKNHIVYILDTYTGRFPRNSLLPSNLSKYIEHTPYSGSIDNAISAVKAYRGNEGDLRDKK